MTAKGAALTECSKESGGRRAVLPTGSTSGTCEGWTGLPGEGGGVRTCWAVYMVVGIHTLTGKLEGGEHEVRQRERTCRGRLISKRGLNVLRRLSSVVVLGGDG